MRIGFVIAAEINQNRSSVVTSWGDPSYLNYEISPNGLRNTFGCY
jgi:hypothetical protein